MDPELFGRLTVFVIALSLWGYCLRRALRADVRSHRLAGAALALALAALPALAVVSLARGADLAWVFVAVGAAVIAAEIAAVALAVSSMSARKVDGGDATARPVVALVLGPLGAVMGFGMAVMPFLMRAGGPDAATPPWSHRIDPPGFEITLPSRAWREAPADRRNEFARFGCPNPAMVAGVKRVAPAASPAAYEDVLGDAKRRIAAAPMVVIDEVRQPNAHGHECWLFMGEEKEGNQRILVAMSVTWWNKSHAVVMIFEGQHRMASRAGQDQEAEAFRAAARSVLTSVK